MKFLLTFTALVFTFNTNALECTKLTVKSADKIKAIYNIEHALTNQQRKKGLMHRKTMPENSGMLFSWNKPAKRAMWMKNTYIPLDMLFIKNNKVIGIVENTKPLTLTPRYINQASDQILEINAFQAQKNSITQGDAVECN